MLLPKKFITPDISYFPKSPGLNFFSGSRSNQSRKKANLFGEDPVVNKWPRFLGKVRAAQLLVGLLLVLSLLTGCATPQQNPYMYTGAGLGALLGAGIGAAANHSNPWRGAAIGALLGGAGGGVAGELYGRSNPYYPPQQQGYYQPAPAPGYSYNRPPTTPQSYASNPRPDEPAGGITTPVTPAPYYQ
jgi:hypothetical protein